MDNRKQGNEVKHEPKDINRTYYADLDHQWHAQIDDQYGITRTIVHDDKRYPPTGIAVIRDATKAKEIGHPDTNLIIESHNVLLRCLSRLRSIDYVLMKKFEECNAGKQAGQAAIYDQQRKVLKKKLDNLQNKIQQIADKKNKISLDKGMDPITELEKEFNSDLCHVLHAAHLDEGCHSAKDYEALLFDYRNLSSLIEPAKVLVTITYDQSNSVIHRDTQYPVTQKTAQQKNQIKEQMKGVTLFPSKEERNGQSVQNIALQEANRYFADLLIQDDRMLPAQTRKTHDISVKNTFLVKNELIFDVSVNQLNDAIKQEKQAKKEDTLYYARSASPVYVGKEIPHTQIISSVKENVKQIAKAAETILGKKPKIHFTSLITDSFTENQNHMLIALRTLEKEGMIELSNIPCSSQASYLPIYKSSIAPRLQKKFPAKHDAIELNRIERHHIAANVSLAATAEDELDVIQCASGQDRTGTITALRHKKWKYDRYNHHGKDKSSIEPTQAKGRNAAEIASHMVSGSRGCKTDSLVKGLFSPDMTASMYLASAKTNKDPHVSKKAIEAITIKTSILAEKQLTHALAKLKISCNDTNDNQLKPRGIIIHNLILDIKNSIKPHEIGTLIRVADETNQLIKTPSRQNLLRYSRLIEGLEKQSLPWKKLGKSMLKLAAVAAVITFGIAFTVHTGGASLAAAIAGAKTITGASMFYHGKKQEAYSPEHKQIKQSSHLVNEMKLFVSSFKEENKKDKKESPQASSKHTKG